MSNAKKLKIVPFDLTATPVRLHDGTNGEGYPQTLEGFAIQAFDDEVYFGDAAVTGDDDGFTVKPRETIAITSFLSRGSAAGYDLNQIYYVGGAFKLILEEAT